MTVASTPSRVSWRPIMAGSEAKRRFQRRSLMSTTAGAVWTSSCALRFAAESGRDASVRKKLGVTRWPSKRSGSAAAEAEFGEEVMAGCQERTTEADSRERVCTVDCVAELVVVGPVRPTKVPKLGFCGVPSRRDSQTITMRLACGYGSGAKRIGLTALKMAVVAPMPRARVRMATMEKERWRRSWRAP